MNDEKKQAIRPEELRIGNLVWSVEANEPTEIFLMGIHRLLEDIRDNKPRSYRGIPLSPEWLERLGFKKEKTGGAGGQDQWAGLSAWSYKGEWIFRGEPSCLHLIGYFNTQIHTVHQLQNLYFALTGQELKLVGVC